MGLPDPNRTPAKPPAAFLPRRYRSAGPARPGAHHRSQAAPSPCGGQQPGSPAGPARPAPPHLSRRRRRRPPVPLPGPGPGPRPAPRLMPRCLRPWPTRRLPPCPAPPRPGRSRRALPWPRGLAARGRAWSGGRAPGPGEPGGGTANSRVARLPAVKTAGWSLTWCVHASVHINTESQNF